MAVVYKQQRQGKLEIQVSSAILQYIHKAGIFSTTIPIFQTHPQDEIVNCKYGILVMLTQNIGAKQAMPAKKTAICEVWGEKTKSTNGVYMIGVIEHAYCV